MSWPSLPTDSLPKFASVLGLLVGTVPLVYLWGTLETDLSELSRLKSDAATVVVETQRIVVELNLLAGQEVLVQTRTGDIAAVPRLLAELEKERRISAARAEQYRTLYWDLQKRREKVLGVMNVLKMKIEIRRLNFLPIHIVSGIGLLAMVWGLCTWYRQEKPSRARKPRAASKTP